MTNCRILSAFAALLLIAGCVKTDPELGGSMIPVSSTYKIVNPAPIPLEVSQLMADSLSGFSNNRITIGAIRKDDEFGLTTRSSAITLVPLFNEKHNMGENRIFKSMRLAVGLDSVSVEDKGEAGILQQVNVYELSKPIDLGKDFNCNGAIAHKGIRVTDGTPIINGSDSLAFWFKEDYGKRYLDSDKYFDDFDAYMNAFPGLYLETPPPLSQGGRINIFDLQLGLNPENTGITGNYAQLNYSAEFDGVRKDTLVLFYLSPTGFYKLDSLIENSSTIKFPQYSLNLTGHQTAGLAGAAGRDSNRRRRGLKPVIAANIYETL